MKNLYELARWFYVRDATKHDLHPEPEQYATEHINALTNDELLERISDALEERLPSCDGVLTALKQAREYINDASPDWHHAKNEMLAIIDAAIAKTEGKP